MLKYPSIKTSFNEQYLKKFNENFKNLKYVALTLSSPSKIKK